MFEPFFGLDFLRIHHTLKVDASIPGGAPEFSVLSNTLSQRYKTTFSAPGIILGFRNNWNIGCGLSLISQISGGAAYCRVHAKSDFLYEQVNTTNTQSETDRKSYKENIIAPQFNFALGLNWDYRLCGFDFDLYAKWEYNRYFNQNYIYYASPLTDAPTGDLSFQGLTAGLNVSF